MTRGANDGCIRRGQARRGVDISSKRGVRGRAGEKKQKHGKRREENGKWPGTTSGGQNQCRIISQEQMNAHTLP